MEPSETLEMVVVVLLGAGASNTRASNAHAAACMPRFEAVHSVLGDERRLRVGEPLESLQVL